MRPSLHAQAERSLHHELIESFINIVYLTLVLEARGVIYTDCWVGLVEAGFGNRRIGEVNLAEPFYAGRDSGIPCRDVDILGVGLGIIF